MRLILSTESPTGYQGVTREPYGNRFNIRVGPAQHVGRDLVAVPQLTTLTYWSWLVTQAPGCATHSGQTAGRGAGVRAVAQAADSAAFTTQDFARVSLVRHCGRRRSVLRAHGCRGGEGIYPTPTLALTLALN